VLTGRDPVVLPSCDSVTDEMDIDVGGVYRAVVEEGG